MPPCLVWPGLLCAGSCLSVHMCVCMCVCFLYALLRWFIRMNTYFCHRSHPVLHHHHHHHQKSRIVRIVVRFVLYRVECRIKRRTPRCSPPRTTPHSIRWFYVRYALSSRTQHIYARSGSGLGGWIIHYKCSWCDARVPSVYIYLYNVCVFAMCFVSIVVVRRVAVGLAVS